MVVPPAASPLLAVLLAAAAAPPASRPPDASPTTPASRSPDAAAAATERPAFDRFLKARLQDHLTQVVHLAVSESTSGAEPRCKALAASMAAHYQRWLTKLGPSPK
jgi:hypothetical protein